MAGRPPDGRYAGPHGGGGASAPPPPPLPPDDEAGVALDVTVVLAVLLLALLLQQTLRLAGPRAAWLTSSSITMLLGAAVNALLWAVGGPHSDLSLAATPAVHDLIYFGLLPPIIFDAGFSLRKRSFFVNFGAILTYAVAGTAVAIAATGALLYGCACAGLLDTRFTLPQALVFASLISSTDTVATLAILRDVKASARATADDPSPPLSRSPTHRAP